MSLSDAELLRQLYQRTLDSFEVDPSNETYYQPLHRGSPADDLPPDPLPALRRPIRHGGLESVQLFSGLRGTGKTTQLRRLEHALTLDGAAVIRVDALEYLNPTIPIDPSSFLLMVAGAVSDAVAADKALLGEDPRRESYWDRFWAFAQETRLELESLGFRASDPTGLAAEVKFKLAREANLRKRLRDLSGVHAGALGVHAHTYLAEVAGMIRGRRGVPDLPVVLVVDSFEKIYGDGGNDAEVYGAAAALFRAHVDKLRIPGWHVVYTVPPWLQLALHGSSAAFDGLYMLPCVKVRHREASTALPGGIPALLALVTKRVPEIARVVPRLEDRQRLAQASGGYVRDCLRLFRGCVGAAEEFGLPLGPERVTEVIEEVRNDYRHVADTDVRWLARVAATGDVELPDVAEVPRLARFFDTHLVLAYRNGKQWFDVHPILAEQVATRSRLLAEREAARADERRD